MNDWITEKVPAGETVHNRCHTFPSLFPDDLVYFREGLSGLNAASDLQADFDPDRQLVTLTVNEDLRRAFRALPREAIPEDGRLHLTTNRNLVKKAIKDSRAEESNWPHIHLLWDLHPVMEWLNFKLMVAFGRKQAPAIRLSGALAAGESLFLIQGEIPNKKGQPVIHEWFAIRFDGHRNVGVLSLQDFLKLTQLEKRTYPNPGEFEIPIAIHSLLPDAVAEARHYMSDRRKAFQQNLHARLEDEIQNLSTLQGRQLSFLEFAFPEDQTLVGARRNKKLERRRHIDAVFAGYRRWVEETLTTEDSPFLRVAAVFLG